MNAPWYFWKWLIPFYNAILVISVLLTICWWGTVVTDSEFLVYIAGESRAVWDLLPTLPTILMLLEYPFNMIPMDWPMLVYVVLLQTLYLLVNIVVVGLDKEQKRVYSSLDWFDRPWYALLYTLALYVLVCVIFAIFYYLTQHVKLKRYARRSEQRFTDFKSSLQDSQESPREGSIQDGELLSHGGDGGSVHEQSHNNSLLEKDKHINGSDTTASLVRDSRVESITSERERASDIAYGAARFKSSKKLATKGYYDDEVLAGRPSISMD